VTDTDTGASRHIVHMKVTISKNKSVFASRSTPTSTCLSRAFTFLWSLLQIFVEDESIVHGSLR